MRIENHGIANAADARRIEQMQRKSAVEAVQASVPEETGDLLALSSGVVNGGDHEATIRRLSAAWHAGTFRPDPVRIAEKLMNWGFDIGPGGL
jgi:hypothetical protein